MGKQKAPAPPDPKDTSAAQTGTSVATSIANALLQNVNQVGADGSTLTYNQTGSNSFTDPYTQKTYALPTFTATQKLSAPAQAIYDTTQSAQGNMATAAKNLSGNVTSTLSNPWTADTSAIESHLFDLGSRTLDPKFAQQRGDLQTQLSNQGIKLGSDAYTRAMSDLGTTQGQAYTDLALRGRGQAFGELQAQRNQPLNELSALLSGSQVSMPNYQTNTPQAIPTTDNAGLINQNYQQKLAAWQQNQATSGGILGGLFNLGGTLGAAAIMSDKRTKTDIKKVGKTDDGQKVYSYRYKHDGPKGPIHMGLMAQEVERRTPEAVEEHGGIKFVNYEKALAGAK